jgi:hypothetical protein
MSTALRAILTAVLSVLLVGFGLCGAYGTFGGVLGLLGAGEGRPFAVLFMVCGLVGLGIAWVCWKAVGGIWRKPGPPAE